MDASAVSKPVTASSEETRTSKGPAKFITLALRGGAAHGAFIPGVLDRRLETRRIGFDGISATRRWRRS